MFLICVFLSVSQLCQFALILTPGMIRNSFWSVFLNTLALLTAYAVKDLPPKGPGKRGHIVADTLPTQMLPRLPGRATFVEDTNFVSGTQKMFLSLFTNILCPQQMFPSLRSPRNIMSNKLSSFARALIRVVASGKEQIAWNLRTEHVKRKTDAWRKINCHLSYSLNSVLFAFNDFSMFYLSNRPRFLSVYWRNKPRGMLEEREKSL